MQVQLSISDTVSRKWQNNLANPRPLMKELSLMALSAIQKNIERNIPPANAPLTAALKDGNNTLRDSSSLRSSLNARSTEKEAAVSTNVRYARVHNPEDGRTETVIRPKNAQYLCLPASLEIKKKMRQTGWSAREVIEGLRAKGVAVYRPYRSGSGTKRANVIMAKEKGKAPYAVFILKKSVTIPARPFMFLSDEVVAAMQARFEAYYEA